MHYILNRFRCDTNLQSFAGLQDFAKRTLSLVCTVLILASLGSCGSGGSGGSTGTSDPSTPYNWNGTWTLVWSDDFSGPDGSSPDPSKWAFDVGGGGWGNQELETYTSRTQNAQIQGGNLVITAIKEDYTGTDGIARNYTSARLKTKSKFSQQYGKFEARIKIPTGQGIWAAFWMLGNNIDTAQWPTCGEIDIMENVGNEAYTVHGSLHGPQYSGANPLTSSYSVTGAKLSDDFHVYAVEWEPKVVRFYVDGNLYSTRTPADIPSGATWVYDHPFFLLMNVAVGGAWPGSPDATTVFPQSMVVDYVKVYSRQ